jgi:hypothetical protein
MQRSSVQRGFSALQILTLFCLVFLFAGRMQATRSQQVQPDAMGTPTLVATTSSSATFVWDAGTEEPEYLVWYYDHSTDTFSSQQQVSGNTHQFTGLSTGKGYDFYFAPVEAPLEYIIVAEIYL